MNLRNIEQVPLRSESLSRGRGRRIPFVPAKADPSRFFRWLEWALDSRLRGNERIL